MALKHLISKLFILTLICCHQSVDAADRTNVPVFLSIEDVDPIALLKSQPNKEASDWLVEIHDPIVSDTIRVICEILFDISDFEQITYSADISILGPDLSAYWTFFTSSADNPRLRVNQKGIRFKDVLYSQIGVIRQWPQLFSEREIKECCRRFTLSYPPYAPRYMAKIIYKIIPSGKQ